jgi:DNA mismatch repair protein MutL
VPKIQRLPADLANQIAAGEVVERPASVVKELIENAIDAGATRLVVAIEGGGKQLIRVEDDGEGMEAADAELAVERHATSKIRRAEDLAAIQTLGFRGEALPSIASVSRFTLRTRARGALSGTEVRVLGGALVSVREVGAPEGTAIEVADLFYNLPARRKFLKSDGAESAQVSRLVTQVALGYPDLGVVLRSGGRTLLQCPPAGDRRARFYQVHGDRPDLVEVRRESPGFSIYGLVAALGDRGPVRGPQNVFVNGRIVKDKTVAHAITAAYSVATIKERSPEVHLFIELPADTVDVNVHPTKAEVRFLDQSFVHEAVRHALQDALGQGAPPPLQLVGEPATTQLPGPVPAALPGVLNAPGYLPRWTPAAPWETDVAALPVLGGGGSVVSAPGHLAPAVTPASLRPLVPLGQFRQTYIIAIDEDGIAIVDQHVAHERVLFEQVMERLSSGPLASQRLLTPIVLDLAPGQRAALDGHRADLDRLGFDVEDFGGGTMRLSAVPALLDLGEAEAALRALAEDLEGLDRGAHVEDALRRIAATTACHAAVKANQALGYEKMVHILDELRRTAYSSVCPHGRPVVLRLTRREIEKNFQRI